MNRLATLLSVVLFSFALTSCSLLDKKEPTSTPEEVTEDFFRQLSSGSEMGAKMHIAQDSWTRENQEDLYDVMDGIKEAKAALELLNSVSYDYVSSDLLDYMEFKEIYNDGKEATVRITIDTVSTFGYEYGDTETLKCYLIVEDGEWKIYDAE